MFRPYKVINRPSKKTDPRAVLCFTALWDPKCLQVFVTECIKYISLYIMCGGFNVGLIFILKPLD